MAAHPEIEVVAGEPGPHQVKISESQIGTKYFARHPVDHNRYAVNASCGDMDTCLSIAAMVRATVPDVEPELFCGHPSGLSSDGVPVRGPWTLPDALPDPKDRLSVCARVTACSVRATGAAKGAVGRACTKGVARRRGGVRGAGELRGRRAVLPRSRRPVTGGPGEITGACAPRFG